MVCKTKNVTVLKIEKTKKQRCAVRFLKRTETDEVV